MSKKIISIVLVFSLMLSILPLALAQDGISYENDPNQGEITYSMQAKESSVDFALGTNYNIIIPSEFNNDENQPNVALWLDSVLCDAPLAWENASGDTRIYDLSVVENLNITNAKEITEVSYIQGTYNISYKTQGGEFVILEYLANGLENKYVRETKSEDVGDVNVLCFDGETQAVTRYETSEMSPQQARGATQVSYPTPAQCGFIDTGLSGTLITTQSVYIEAMGAYQTARVIKHETEYKNKAPGGFRGEL